MKPFRLLLFVAAAAAAVASLRGADPAAAPKMQAAPPLSPRFKQVRARIDALFRNRNETPPPPDGRLSPFRLPGGDAAADSRSTATPGDAALPGASMPESAGSDLSRLQEGVATLKVSGTFEKDGRLYLVINAKPYKDNDVIQTQVQGETVYLRVRQISRRGVTVVLNAAEMTLKF